MRLAPAVALALLASASAGRAEERVFTLKLEAAEAPAVLRVARGDTVVLRFTSATAAEVHLHGYAREAKLGAGETREWRFVAHATGRYPIQVHRPGDAGGARRHGAPFAYLEVRPP